MNKGQVYTPNDDRLSALHSLRRIDGIAPNDVPSCMVVVRLDCPRASTALRLQGFIGRRVQSSAQRKVRKSLLGHIRVFVALVRTEGVEGPHSKNANHPAEYVCLLEI